jgi:transcriptional regulator with PAS, ATPase and Fis domain
MGNIAGCCTARCPCATSTEKSLSGMFQVSTSKTANELKKGCNRKTSLREEIDKASMFEEIVGTSTALQAVLSRVSKVAPSDSTVLITGETGTGKELVASAIHRRSHRASRAFISVNCAAIPVI